MPSANKWGDRVRVLWRAESKIRGTVGGLSILATKLEQPHHVGGVCTRAVVSHDGFWRRNRQAMECWLDR